MHRRPFPVRARPHPRARGVARKRLALSREVPASWAISAWVARISDVASPRRPPPGARSTWASSAPATRPATVWKDCWSSRSLARRSRSASAASIFSAISGLERITRWMSPREQGHERGVLERLGRGRARLAAEHGQLAEDGARAELGQRQGAPVHVLAPDAHRAAADHVARVARVALAEDHLARARSCAARPPARPAPARAPRARRRPPRRRAGAAVSLPPLHERIIPDRWPSPEAP